VVDSKTYKWICRGKQKRLVVEHLCAPMTAQVLLKRMRCENPHVYLRDLWRLLGAFSEKGLIRSLCPGQTTGRIFYWSRDGIIYRGLLGFESDPVPSVDWNLYSFVMRGKTRLHVLFCAGNLLERCPEGVSATQTRRALREAYPLSLNAVIRSISELRSKGLLEVHGSGSKSTQPLYCLTKDGKAIFHILERVFSYGLFTTFK
jgi:DNA-binding HxlR family transcriptional regulator